MIVVDTNILAYLIIRGSQSSEADKVYQTDSEWASPPLWRSEFRNVLIGCIRRGTLGFDEALGHMSNAELIFRGASMRSLRRGF